MSPERPKEGNPEERSGDWNRGWEGLRFRGNYTTKYESRKALEGRLFLFVLLRIYLPPELLAEVLRAATDALEVVEVVSRDSFENLAQATHGELRETVCGARVIKMSLEETHQFAALCFTRRLPVLIGSRGQDVRDALHWYVVYQAELYLRDLGANRGEAVHQVFVAAVDAVHIT